MGRQTIKSSKMRIKILMFCIGSTLIALCLQAILFKNTSAEIIYNQSKETNLNSMQHMQDDIFDRIKSIERSLIEVYNDRQLMEDLIGNEDISHIQKNNYRVAYNIALNHFEASDYVVAIYLYDKSDRIISTYRHAMTPEYNYPSDIYEDAVEYNADKVKEYIHSDNNIMLVSSYYNKDRKTNIIRFVLKIYENVNINNEVGYIICDIDSKSFINIMEKYVTSNDSIMWLQPLGDRPVASIIGDLNNDIDFYEAIAIDIEDMEKGEEVSSHIKDRVFFQIKQNKYNLQAYSIMPQSYLIQSNKALSKNLIFSALIMIVIFSVLSIMVSKEITSPLEKLMNTMKKIKKGDTSLRVEITGSDEIAELAKQFNEMLDRIETLIVKEYKAELLLAKAKYNALQAQINPHFLYNTLDAMSSIASLQNCSVVSSLSQSLSSIFRYCLDMKNPMSTVEKEIIHLKNYIYVMDVRMQDNIKYTIDIDKEILKDSIPRISIQPIVENALKHGIREKKEDKEIRITGKVIGDDLQIMVMDNGKGMDSRLMNQELSRGDFSAVESGNSIGLYNINARVKMLYGNDYGIHITSELDKGTSVCLTVSRRKESDINEWEKV